MEGHCKEVVQMEGGVAVEESSSHTVYYDHPDHIVIVNTHPQFGPSLSSLAYEDDDKQPD